jgi:hypothetical protein
MTLGTSLNARPFRSSTNVPDDRRARARKRRVVAYTFRNAACTMRMMERLNLTLDDEQAAKLVRLAERMHVQPGTVARSLLATAIDEADPDVRNVVELLDGLSAAHGRAQLGLTQARTGQTIALDDL